MVVCATLCATLPPLTSSMAGDQVVPVGTPANEGQCHAVIDVEKEAAMDCDAVSGSNNSYQFVGNSTVAQGGNLKVQGFACFSSKCRQVPLPSFRSP